MYYIGGTSHWCCCSLCENHCCLRSRMDNTISWPLSFSLTPAPRPCRCARHMCNTIGTNMEHGSQINLCRPNKMWHTISKIWFLNSPWKTEPVHRTTYVRHSRTMKNYSDRVDGLFRLRILLGSIKTKRLLITPRVQSRGWDFRVERTCSRCKFECSCMPRITRAWTAMNESLNVT